MHSNNVLRNIFSHNQDIGMIILHQYPPLTSQPILFVSNKLNSCTTCFFFSLFVFKFPMGLQIIICTVPIS